MTFSFSSAKIRLQRNHRHRARLCRAADRRQRSRRYRLPAQRRPACCSEPSPPPVASANASAASAGSSPASLILWRGVPRRRCAADAGADRVDGRVTLSCGDRRAESSRGRLPSQRRRSGASADHDRRRRSRRRWGPVPARNRCKVSALGADALAGCGRSAKAAQARHPGDAAHSPFPPPRELRILLREPHTTQSSLL